MLKACERKALEDFRDMKISLEELRPLIRQRMSFEFEPRGFARRSIDKYLPVAEPGVLVSIGHLQDALNVWKLGKMSKGEIADWAAMLLMNDDFEIDETNEDVVAEWLNQVALDEVVPEVIKA
jgi:hypothetical protein